MEIVINDGKKEAYLFLPPTDKVRIELGRGFAVSTDIMPMQTKLDYETMKLLVSLGYFNCEGGNFELGEKSYSTKHYIDSESIYALRHKQSLKEEVL